jgi:hypothetical protein
MEDSLFTFSGVDVGWAVGGVDTGTAFLGIDLIDLDVSGSDGRAGNAGKGESSGFVTNLAPALSVLGGKAMAVDISGRVGSARGEAC